MSEPELVVYGADWCPDVRRSRALLDGEGVAYRYVDVEADPHAEALVRRLQDGARRIPTIVRADGAHLVEPSDDALRRWLGAAEAWTTDEDLAAARERFAAQVPGWVPPVAYALARRDPGGLVFGHVNRLGEARGLPAAALATRCDYAGRSGTYDVAPAVLAEVLQLLAPALAATHVPHPNLWSWQALLDEAPADAGFVAFLWADADDAPRTDDERQFCALARVTG